MKNPDNIQISLKPIITIGIVIFVLILSGSILDSVRSYSKLKKVVSHAQIIMSANSSKILNAFRDHDEIVNTLNQINGPEKNTYQISFLTKKDNEWKLYAYNYSVQTYVLDSTAEKVINEATNNDGTIQTIKGEDIFPNLNQYNQNQFILAGFPINADGQSYGYILVSVNKTTDLD